MPSIMLPEDIAKGLVADPVLLVLLTAHWFVVHLHVMSCWNIRAAESTHCGFGAPCGLGL